MDRGQTGASPHLKPLLCMTVSQSTEHGLEMPTHLEVLGMGRKKTFVTKGGVRVEIRFGRVRALRRGKPDWKVMAYRVDTGGYHGLLWLRNLTPIS